MECLSGCPGYEEGEGTCGVLDVPPHAYCDDEPEPSGAGAAGEAVAAVVGVLLGVAYVVAVCIPHPEACKDDNN